MPELAQSFTVTWGQLGAVAAVVLGVPATLMALVRVGDRLWNRRNGNDSLSDRVSRLEGHACHAKKELGEIKSELREINQRLYRILERRE